MAKIPGTEIPFSVRKEDWSKYEIFQGDAIVWARVILIKLYELDKADVPAGALPPGATRMYQGATQTVIAAFFQEDRRGEPGTSPIAPSEFEQSGTDVKFQALDEPWNEYIIPGTKSKILTTKAVATRIRVLSKRMNGLGDPAVSVDLQVVLGPPRDARPEELHT